MPRSWWETGGAFGGGPDGGTTESVRTLFDKAGRTAESSYVFTVDARHPGSENWTMCMTEMMFKQNAATMDRMVSAAGWKAAYSHDSSIVYGHEWGRTSPRGSGRGETSIGGRPTIIRVRFTGLRGAARLNGREGVIEGADMTNYERTIVRLADGTEVSVKPENYVVLNE